MPKYRQDELDNITQAYVAGCALARAGLLEDALPYFDQVLGRLPRRRRDRTYRIEPARTLPLRPNGIHWLPPVFRDALLAKAYCLNELGRSDDAFALLERAVELDPENPQVYAELGFAHGSRDNIELARTAYHTAAELEPHNPAHLCALAHLALLTEEYADARALALRALTLETDATNALQQLAYAEYRLGNLEGTITALQRVVELAPDNTDSILRLAGTLQEAGRVREAIDYLQAYLEHDPNDAEALALMTDLLQQDGSASEIIPHAHRLLARNPADAVALDLLAWGLYQQGHLEDALHLLRRLVQTEPAHSYHHFKLGMVYQSLGQYREAMAALLRALTLDERNDAREMTMEALNGLDQLQIEQILIRARADAAFRQRLVHQQALALHQAGFLLSPFGVQFLETLDFTDHEFSEPDRNPEPPPTLH